MSQINLPAPAEATRTALAKSGPSAESIERLLVDGDLARLKPAEKVTFYTELCNRLGLNPFTRPFQFLLTKENKLILYAGRDAADQLRKLHGVSIEFISREVVEGGIYEVTVKATDATGRTDMATGSASILDKADKPLKGTELSNARMRAETKAKRRVTLSIVGLGFLDETEVETIKGARKVSWEEAMGREGTKPITGEQAGRMLSLAAEKGVSQAELQQMVGKDDLSAVTQEQYLMVLKALELRLPGAELLAA